jgi:YD repeat-containing protein
MDSIPQKIEVVMQRAESVMKREGVVPWYVNLEAWVLAFSLAFFTIWAADSRAAFPPPTDYGATFDGCAGVGTSMDAAGADLMECMNGKEVSNHTWYYCGIHSPTAIRINGYDPGSGYEPCEIFGLVGVGSSSGVCPANSTLSGGQCVCNASFLDANGTCSGGKINGPSTRPGSVCVGNPCNPANGNKVEQQLVYRGLNGFELTLTFNTFDYSATRVGSHRRDSFDGRVLLDGSDVVVYRPDGETLRFVPNGGAWVTDADTSNRLVELQNPPGTRIGWQLFVANGDELQTYDANGKLLTIQSRSGLTQALTYSDGTSGSNGSVILDANGNPTTAPLPAGLLIRASDNFGRTLAFGYNAALRVTKVTDPAGGVYRFAYDAAKNLVSIAFPDNKVRTYVYNESANTGGANLPSALTGIVDENGDRFATFKYDTQQRAVSTEHALGALRYAFSYTTGSTVVTDPLSTARTYSFETVLGAFKHTGITGPVCPECGPASQTFDANGNISSRVDWNGNRTNYTYDLARNLEISRTEGLISAGGTTPATRIIDTQWHATFRLPTQITEKDSGGAVLRTTGMTHDANGNVLTRTVTAGASSRTWTYTYNANGSVLTIDGPRTDLSDVTTYTYYANNATCPGASAIGCRGQVETITNAVGHVTSIAEYNAHGQPLTIVDPNGLTTTLAYDSRQRLNSRNVGGETTNYEYGGAGQLKKVTLPDGSFLSYTYDAAHRLTAITDNLGNKISYTLDAMGNRTLEEVRDPVNQLAQTRSRVYSNLNLLAQEIGAQSQTTSYAYDNQGNITAIDGPLAGTGDTTTNTYDALNRLIRVTDPNSGQVNYGYNAIDQLTSVTDPRSLVTSYNYDGLNNLNQLVSPDTGTTTNTYDAAGNLLTQTDAKGQVTNYAYDALSRVTSIAYQGGATHIYQYDQGTNGKGRLTQITEPNSTTQYVYDPKGRLVTETRTVNAIAYATGYSYDSSGRLSGMTYPSGRTIAYTFDSLGRIQGITTTQGSAQAVLSSATYHPFGPVKSFTFGNSQTYTRGYDQDGRVASYTLGTQSFAVGYDLASRIGFISDIGNPPNSNTYSYDNLDRLTNAVIPGTPFAYSYDAVGNRLTKTVGSSTDTYTPSGTSNRLASITPGTGPVRSYVHDPNGSITADGVNTYAYDSRGRMTQAVSAIGTTSYQVNSLGQRIRKTNIQGDTVFHYDRDGRLIAESSPSGAIQKEYIYLGDIPVAVAQ